MSLDEISKSSLCSLVDIFSKLAQSGQGGNSAEQSISQSQSSSQNSQVVSGADTIGSGNNINVQSQENSGSNAAAQS